MPKVTWNITTDKLVRAATDVVLVNIGLVAALLTGYVVISSHLVSNPVSSNLLGQLFLDYQHLAIPLTIISLVLYGLFGFYTRARLYRSKLKALIICTAVTLSYLFLSFAMSFTNLSSQVLQQVLFWGWGYTLLLVGGSRLWSVAWRHFTVQQSSKVVPDDRLVLVIGGAGYIGSALLPKLLKSGYRVRILDSLLYGKQAILPFVGSRNVELIQSDFRNIDQVVKAVKGVGTVIHLGAIVGDPACSVDEELTIEVNWLATRMIAEICKGFEVKRFIFASTCSVYGASDAILNETSDCTPLSSYARSKLACERVLKKMESDSFKPIMLRFGTVFGFSGRTRFDLVVNILAAKAKFEGKITLYGGDQWRPFVHVDDVAGALQAVLKSSKQDLKHNVYNVGSNENNYTLAQVAQHINRFVPEATVEECGADEKDKRNYQVDFTRLQNETGFKAKWSLDDGVAQVIEAIDAGHVLDYREKHYSNLSVIQEGGHAKKYKNMYDMESAVSE